MKKHIILAAIAAMAMVIVCSCSRSHSDATINNAWNAPTTIVDSYNDFDLVIEDANVSYTIDVSTPEGKIKLHKLSEKKANELALVEVLIKYGCDMLINPQFTHLKKGKKILRVTVYGKPAKYKNQSRYNQAKSCPSDNITINNNIEYNSTDSKTTQQKPSKRRRRR